MPIPTTPTPLTRRDTVLIAVYLPICVVVIPLVQAYITNYDELRLSSGVFVAGLLALFVALLLPALVALMASKNTLQQSIAMGFFAVSVVSMLLCNVLTWDFTAFRTGAPDWSQYRGRLWIELVLLGGVTVAVVRWWPIVRKHCVTVMGLTLLYVLISSSGRLQRFIAERFAVPSTPIGVFTPDRVFDFSSTTNCIVLHVDAFQSDLFYELVTTNPGLRADFNGFTYFPNALSPNAPKTQLCVANYLASSIFRADSSVAEFRRRFLERPSSLPSVLAENGFDSRVLQRYESLLPDSRLWNNVASHDAKSNARSFEKALAIALFKTSPIVVKQALFPTGDFVWPGRRRVVLHFGWLPLLSAVDPHPDDWESTVPPFAINGKSVAPQVARDGDFLFLRDFQANAAVSMTVPVMRHYLIRGLHLPLFTDANYQFVQRPDIQYGNTPVPRPLVMESAAAYLEWLQVFLRTLKKIGAYDNTFLVIIGDHGLGVPVGRDFAGHTQRLVGDALPDAQQPLDPTAEPDVPRRRLEMSLPLVLVKPLNATGPLATSFAPVSLIDIPPTVLAGLGIDGPGASDEAVDIFSLNETERRPRRVCQVVVTPQSTIYAAHEFIVDGFSWLRASWSEPAALSRWVNREPR